MTHDPTEPTDSTVKTLFAYSGNVCAFFEADRQSACEETLTNPNWERVKARICHIAGRRPGGPRYDVSMTDADRRAFDNLILLCPNHHARVDDLEPKKYTIPLLQAMKERGMQCAEAPEKWSKDQTLVLLANLLLGQMRNTWAGEDSRAGETQQLHVFQRPDGMIAISNMGPGRASQVKVGLISGAPDAIRFADVQGFTIDEGQEMAFGQQAPNTGPQDVSPRLVRLGVTWVDHRSAECHEDFTITVPRT